MNTIAASLMLVVIAYFIYLCLSAFRVPRTTVCAKSPMELLNAVAHGRSHHGFQVLVSLSLTLLSATIKAIAAMTGNYEKPPLIARLAFGTADNSIAAKLGLIGLCLILVTIIEAVLFIKYDAYLRMMVALKTWLKLDVQIR